MWIKGFYDDVIPLTAEEKKAIAAISDVTPTLKKELAIAEPDGDGVSYLELLSLPSLNINGIQSANAGKLAANIIPATAEATLDLRLVPGNDVERQVQKVKDYIRLKGYHIIDHDPTDDERAQYGYLIKITTDKGYNAQRTPMNLPIAQTIIKAVQSTTDYPVLLKPSSGGSLPLFLFEKYLNAKPVSVPVVNYDNNQHAENENVKVQYLLDGINTVAAAHADEIKDEKINLHTDPARPLCLAWHRDHPTGHLQSASLRSLVQVPDSVKTVTYMKGVL